ncbi:MAG TPA: hypothetical protein VFZ23_18465 [Pyrinomonadaceae bacterium]
MSEGFQPLDAIRSSYRLQRRQLPYAGAGEINFLFERDRNTNADIARACTVYSTVPYLGILFIPLALVFSGFGYLAYLQRPHIGGKRTSLTCIGVSLILLAVQLLLWWLLYLIPELGL